MRIAASLAAGILLACLGTGLRPASAAPSVAPLGEVAGSTVEQARMVRRPHYRRGGNRVMGLPTPGSRARRHRTRLPRI